MESSQTALPLVTIITATYNAASTLEHTLESVREQDYPSIEHLVIDGGSTDGTLEILQRNNSTIGYWVSEPDRGIYDAWNKGIKNAKGVWIAFLGADDVLLPGAVSSYMKLARKNPCADYLCSKVRRMFIAERPRIVGAPWNFTYFRRSMTVAHPGSMHKHTLFDRLGVYDLSYRIVGDYELLLRARADLDSAYMPNVTVEMAAGGVSDGTKAIFEAYRAKRETGDLSVWLAKWDLTIALLKYRLRPLRKYYLFALLFDWYASRNVKSEKC